MYFYYLLWLKSLTLSAVAGFLEVRTPLGRGGAVSQLIRGPERLSCRAGSFGTKSSIAHWLLLFQPSRFNIARSFRPSRLRRQKVHVKSQWSCSGVQLAPLRVLSLSLHFKWLLMQIKWEGRTKCKNVRWISISTIFLTHYTDGHLLQLNQIQFSGVQFK